ncbi:unnamed protein product [Brassica oleracea var. botrytis]
MEFGVCSSSRDEEMELDSKNKNSIETETSEETTCLSICQSKWRNSWFQESPRYVFLFNVAGLKMVVCESTPLIRSGEQALLCDVQGCRKLMFSINFSAARILKDLLRDTRIAPKLMEEYED